MERTVLVFPVVPGSTQEQIESMAEMFRSRPEEYAESRKNLGISLERVYHQPTPMGDLVVVYAESDGDVAETMGRLVGSDLQIDKDFVRMIKEVHGVDVTQPPQFPPAETIGDWTDPEATTRGKGLAFCFPGIPGQEDAGSAFTREAFQDRRDELTASRRDLNETVEVVTLQYSPQGPVIGVYLEGEDPVKANQRFAASTAPFDAWFKGELKKVAPPEIDFDQPLPPVKEIFDSAAM